MPKTQPLVCIQRLLQRRVLCSLQSWLVLPTMEQVGEIGRVLPSLVEICSHLGQKQKQKLGQLRTQQAIRRGGISYRASPPCQWRRAADE